MKTYKSLLLFVIGFFFFFFIGRILMLLFHFSEVSSLKIEEYIPAFYQSFALDFSIISYGSILLLFFIFLKNIFQNSTVNKLLNLLEKIWIYFVGIIYSILVASEIATYFEWKSKLQSKALVHLEHPTEVLYTGNAKYNLVFIAAFFILLFIVFCIQRLYSKFQTNFSSTNDFRSIVLKSSIFVILAGLHFLVIRGGFDQIPIQISRGYYSSHRFCNDLSVNTPFAFFSSVVNNKKAKHQNPYQVMEDSQAKYLTNVLYGNHYNPPPYIFKTPNVNIVYIILESMRADVCSSFGSRVNATPFMSQLSKDGLIFSNTYASGWTSDQGIVSLFSSTPQFEVATVLSDVENMRKLPILGNYINHKYSSSFYYGGNLDYANIKAYLVEQKFKKVMDIKDFKDKYPSGKLGIHDGYMFPELANQLDELPQPFFSAFFTQSTHSPYDFPKPVSFHTDQQPEEYYRGAFYTDSSVQRFFDIAKTKSWYKNTVFVFVADHTRMIENTSSNESSENFRILHFWYGEPILPEFRNKHIETIHSQSDILKTLLTQIEINTDAYPFSRDIFTLPKEMSFAPITFHNIHGWISPNCNWMYNSSFKKYYQEPQDSTCRIYSHAFFQHTFKEFIQSK